MRALLLRLDAPLMSFGGVRVDHHNRTEELPIRSMLCGLIANALGMDRRDEDEHEALQRRIRYAARRDRAGAALTDYQTVDLGSPAMSSALGWTTRGVLEGRKGGEAAGGTHIRLRHYLADAIVTVAVTLEPEDEVPTLEEIEQALRRPARPIFLGRRCCIPSTPLVIGSSEFASLREALERVPRAPGAGRADAGQLPAIWPLDDGEEANTTRRVARTEDRDWRNAVHVGRRFYVEGLVNPPAESP